MKAESDTMPTHPFVIDKRGDLADITFFEGVKESEREDRTVYEYDSHTLTVAYRDGLTEMVSENLSVWLEEAKKETAPNETASMEEMAVKLMETQTQLQDAQDALDFLIMGGI